MRTAIVFCLAVGLCGPAAAQEQEDCKDPQSQSAMNFCANQDYEKADAELNALWKEAHKAAKELDAEEPDAARRGAEKALLASQRAWLAYRDGQCDLAGWEAHGGSMEPMLVSGCLADLTRARTKELKETLLGEGQ